MTPSERYILTEVAPGALLLDRASGVTLELNPAAVLVWRLHLSGKAFDEIATVFATHFQVSPQTARTDVTSSLTGLPPFAPPPALPREFGYHRSGNHFVFSRNGEALFVVDQDGESLSMPSAARLTPHETKNFLYGLSPKLLSLRGHIVLHASAVALGERVFAFSGQSGAGKTTTARAMVNAGATLICEDKLLLQRGGAELAAFSAGEEAIRRWVVEATMELAAGRSVPCGDLDSLSAGTALRLAEIGFVSAERRGDSLRIEALPLSALQTAGAIFNNSFHGSDAPEDWGRELKASADTALGIAAYELIVPNGLPELADAAKAVVTAGSLRSR